MRQTRSAFILAAALLLAACAPLLSGLAGLATGPAPQAVQTASAPLARTRVDESAYRTALAGANTLRLSINVIIARGGLVRNSPPALRVRQGLIALRDSLRAARALLDAMNDPISTLSPDEIARKLDEYRAAMRAAEQAAEEIGEALGDRSSAAEAGPINQAIADVRDASADAAATR